jgi:16S rRNA (guanine1207-N2)-methyltransferase
MSATDLPALETLMLALMESSTTAPLDSVPTLFLGASPHRALPPGPNLLGWQPIRPLAALWDQSGAARCDELPDGLWPRILFLPGKSRSEILAGIGEASARLQTGGELLVALPNDCGAARYEKEFASACGGVNSLQKHKCRAFRAIRGPDWDEATFAAWRSMGAPHATSDGRFLTQAGVFSEDGIDAGSALLAKSLPASLRGRVADLGAGWGFLAAQALETCPHISEIDLYEADSRALACARANLAPLAGNRRICCHWEDVTCGVSGSNYDVVLMNPPFHTGRQTDVALGVSFVKASARALRRGGTLWMVANRQLPYEGVLDACGFSWWKRAENPVFKVFQATKR